MRYDIGGIEQSLERIICEIKSGKKYYHRHHEREKLLGRFDYRARSLARRAQQGGKANKRRKSRQAVEHIVHGVRIYADAVCAQTDIELNGKQSDIQSECRRAGYNCYFIVSFHGSPEQGKPSLFCPGKRAGRSFSSFRGIKQLFSEFYCKICVKYTAPSFYTNVCQESTEKYRLVKISSLFAISSAAMSSKKEDSRLKPYFRLIFTASGDYIH